MKPKYKSIMSNISIKMITMAIKLRDKNLFSFHCYRCCHKWTITHSDLKINSCSIFNKIVNDVGRL